MMNRGRRVRYAIAALVLAGVFGLARPAHAAECSPLCHGYEPWSFLWLFHQCWTCPPPSPEG